MCGIFACVDQRERDVSALAIEGLMRLRYRGYDSYGFASFLDSSLALTKSLEPLDNSVSLPESRAVIGHTRWATHGKVLLENCHPWLASEGNFALIHNGVVENFQVLRQQDVDSDTAVIAALLEETLLPGKSRTSALKQVMDRLEGLNSVVVLFDDGEIVAARQGPPLQIARGNGRIFLASDALSFSDWADEVCSLESGQLVSISASQASLLDANGTIKEVAWQTFEHRLDDVDLDGYSHHMLKEVMEQWRTLPGESHLTNLDILTDRARQASTVFVAGAGGAHITARQIAYLLSRIAGLNAVPVAVYDMDAITSQARKGDLFLAVSQSGETADTISAAQEAREWGCTIASLTNMPLSTLAAMADLPLNGDVGPEICVLSTKSASAQIAFGYLFAHDVISERAKALSQLSNLSAALAEYLSTDTLRSVQAIVDAHCDDEHIYVLGHNLHRPTAAMAALNIKEASYIHAEAFSAGELKHGVLALIEEGTLVILYGDQESKRALNAGAEVKARGARLLGIGGEDNGLYDYHLPLPDSSDHYLASVSGIIPGQLLAYQFALSRGLNPDRPRNLAKSVTVL